MIDHPTPATDHVSAPGVTSAVITGATGFLGSHFVLNFVGTRISRAYLLMRGDSVDRQRARLRDALDVANQSYLQKRNLAEILDRVVIVSGDITSPLLGVDESTLAAVGAAAPDELWHFAASLNYEQRRATEIELANITGTANVIEFCKHVGIQYIYHCSTAYVCGTAQGVIQPVLHDRSGAFSNHYEQTKCGAEHLLHEAAGQAGLAVTVLRPTVVIGNSETKRPGGSTSGLYGLLREFHRIKSMLADEASPTRLWFEKDATVNVVPVDEVMRQIKVIVDGADDRQRFSVHHLVSAACPTNEEFFGQIRDVLGLAGLVMSNTNDHDMTGLEELIDQRLEFYRSYFRADRSFVPSVADAATVAGRDIGFYLREGVKALERSDITSVFRFATVTASDGVKLNTYSIGESNDQAILICNAVGMPADLVSQLSISLAELATVLTWESRGLPSKDTDFTHMDVSLARQAQDGIEVLTAAGVKTAVIIGWCAGARLAIELAAIWPGQIRGLVLLNGGYNLQTTTKTPFETSMNTAMPKISRDRRLAEVFYHGIFAAGTTQPSEAAARPDGLLRSASANDVYLASLPFHCADNLYRYSRLTTAYIETPFTLHDTVKRIPTLVMTGDADKTASPQSSRAVAELMPEASFVSINGADHYSLHWDDVFKQQATTFAAQAMQSPRS